jgi:hypothetical protein
MSIPHSIADVLTQHVTLELESLDRVYLNVYQPRLQTPRRVFQYLREQHGPGAVSSHCMRQITQRFLRAIEDYAWRNGVPLISFERKQRKEDLAAEHAARFHGAEGILFIGKAQEKVRTFRTEGRRNVHGETYPWIVESTAMVNQYYFYGMDADFGPFFLKYSSYFPYGAKLCFNGHEYLKRQLRKEKIAFEELANGILRCANPQRMQHLANSLTGEKIERFLRKWQRRLPHPLAQAERAGYRYQVSMTQVEFALTQVVAQPRQGRVFFEEVIRENVDLGRPENIQLIFARRVTRRTPGTFRTRIVREGVIPSLYVDYKTNRLKQYFKEGRALRTELTVHNPRDFSVNRGLEHLSALREVAFQTNRRVLHVQKISQDFALSEQLFEEVTQPQVVDEQRVSALRFGDPTVLALFAMLVWFRFLPQGFRRADLQEHLPALLGADPSSWTPGRLTYQLRRLRLHGLIERLPRSNRYQVSERGLRVALWFTRCHARLFRPALGELLPEDAPTPGPLRRALQQFDRHVDNYLHTINLQPA